MKLALLTFLISLAAYSQDAALLDAQDILARTSFEGADQRIVEKMKEKASRVRFNTSGTSRECKVGFVAWVSWGTTVHICPKFFENTNPSIAQYYLLHELAHLGGIGDECEANMFTRKILYFAGENINFTSGYDAQCRVDSKQLPAYFESLR